MVDPARLDELRRLFAAHPRRYAAPLASALRRSGQPHDAVALLRAELAERPEHLTGHVILGQALTDVGDAAGAEAAYARAHAVDEGNVVALGALVELALARGDDAAASHWRQRLAEADPEPAGARPAAPTPAAAHDRDSASENGSDVGSALPATFELIDFTEVEPPSVDAAAPEPAVGLDLPPADPVPAPMREAMPALGDEDGAEDGVEGDGVSAATPAPFVTETMAGLLAAQGHTAQALDVYVQLLAQRPDDARLRARVDALRGGTSARDAWGAAMWHAALAPVPDPAPAAAPVSGELDPETDAEPAAGASDPAASDPTASDPSLDDLSFDRFFEAFGDEPDPAPAEPAGDFERWADGVTVTGAGAAAPYTAEPAGITAAAVAGAASDDGPSAPAPDDPDADLAAFKAWLRGLDA